VKTRFGNRAVVVLPDVHLEQLGGLPAESSARSPVTTLEPAAIPSNIACPCEKNERRGYHDLHELPPLRRDRLIDPDCSDRLLGQTISIFAMWRDPLPATSVYQCAGWGAAPTVVTLERGRWSLFRPSRLAQRQHHPPGQSLPNRPESLERLCEEAQHFRGDSRAACYVRHAQ
jgi:hypothetical protein